MIHAWDNYPPGLFPKLWEWLAEEVRTGQLRCPAAAFGEIGHKLPECCTWLNSCNCSVEQETNLILNAAMTIKQQLGVLNDQYHVDGVDENDVLIIATAKALGHSVVSNERRQTTLPTNLKRYKIPAVCGITAVAVACSDFAEYFKASGKVF